ncbi:DUF4230 domain-containing protein [Neolewinella aurantiaca]|uniref:DUF4230 domain-containing protein n=1 Tax=Neolewinella aurantiaca TaxID=2602767 RepID=A0A5C7F9X4_9BACT|nr:DUF4230 domain-containing protein [Neolewinella aurantiaca]TXF87571.1 DUF4230 domain-containing protein [Neolewinella aurantiaca]
MADQYQGAPSSSKGAQSRGSNYTQIAIVVLIAGILGTLAYKAYKPGSGFLAAPAEYQLQYMPADFQISIDPEQALAILQNPKRYKREFDALVYDINTDILKHVSNRMGLNDSLRSEVIREYDRQQEEFASLYYNDFMRMRDSTAAEYEAWYEEGGSKLITIFEEVASNYTCFMVNKILAVVIRTRNGNILAKGADVNNPCKVATGEALRPLMARMEERAKIDDFSRSKGMFQEKVENVIGELATIEVKDKKGISKQLQTSIWGMNVSETDVEITAISILKVGFRLDQQFQVDLDERSKVVTITLPDPQILSHEVLPKIEKLDIGWMRELEGVNINEGVNALREAFRSEAIESDVFRRAKVQATDLMNTMFQPMVRGIGKDYRIEVEFRQIPVRETTGVLE